MKTVVNDIPKGYKESVLGIIPDDWSVVRLKDKFDRITTKNKKGVTNVLTISAQQGLINQEEFFNKSVASKDLSNYILLEKGDFAYNKSYSNGYPYGAIKKLKNYDEGVVSSLYICFRPSKNNKSSDFYEQYFEAGMLNHEIHAIAQEGARNHGLLNISIADFFNSFIIDGDENELNKIADILFTWDKAIELKEKLIEQKKEQKKGLMQKLLTGEVRLPGFEGEWEEYKVEDICALGRGRVISKKEIAENPGIYPVYSSQTSDEGKIGSINKYDFDGEYITWTTDGVNAGTVFYRNGKFNCTNVCGVLKLKKENIDARYLSYILQASTDKYVVRNGNPKLMNNIMAIIPIKIFNNYEYQKYICDLFDLFDKELKLLEKEVVDCR
ncbi:restriction endonuclease subunit S [Bacillus sp. FSL W8-0102]|uniref:restriction endonuclease subunit S n=1 Tax=Bacillus sp. FSL W8-0102 TaxID=2978205 RepID=UPI0030FA2945